VRSVKKVEVRIMQLSPQSSPMTSFLMVNFTAEFQSKHRERVHRERMRYFQPISRRISETVQDMSKVTMTD